MRLIRSRSSRTGSSSGCSSSNNSTNSSFRATSKNKTKDSAGLDRNTWGLVTIAVLPLLAMTVVSTISTALSPFFDTVKRTPYRFSWGEALDQRTHLAAKYNHPPHLPSGIPRIDSLSVAEFRDMWDAKWPVIITDVVPQWKAYKWSKDFLFKFYSKSNLTVTKAKGSLKQAEGHIITLSNFYKQTFEKTTSSSWIYANDEHFISNHPSLLLDIGLNKYASEDYFEYFPEELRPKNAMLLWGTKYSRSKFHIDPYNWTGTVALLKGVKKWKLYPPSFGNPFLLKRQRSGFPLDCSQLVSPLDMFSKNTLPDSVKQMLQVTVGIQFEQKAGDLLIIPTGWSHQAYNVEETIAISSQFMNRNNYRAVLEEIIQCADINDDIPIAFSSMTAEEQVKTVMSLIPSEIMEQARDINNKTRNLLMCGEDNSS